MKKKIVAVIVTRKNSRRVKNKNTRIFYNQDSLLSLKIKQLKKVKNIHQIIVGSDDPKAKIIANKFKVKFYKRKKAFCDEKSKSANDMIKNMLSHFVADYVIWTHCTNPFVNETVISEAVNKFLNNKKKRHDSLFCANKLVGHFYNHKTIPLNHNPRSKNHKTAMSLPHIMKDNGSIFIRKFDQMKRDGNFIGKNPLVLETDCYRGWDIDTINDFRFAKKLAGFFL